MGFERRSPRKLENVLKIVKNFYFKLIFFFLFLFFPVSECERLPFAYSVFGCWGVAFHRVPNHEYYHLRKFTFFCEQILLFGRIIVSDLFCLLIIRILSLVWFSIFWFSSSYDCVMQKFFNGKLTHLKSTCITNKCYN